MHRNKSVDVHKFSMIPKADIPRSTFKIEKTHKTAFDSGYLVPIYLDEVLPGDSFSLNATLFGRLATPIFPVMDNLHVDTFFFFVPNRLVWDNWQKFMGEQIDPGDSIDYTIPQVVSPAGGYAVGSLQDYMGLPTVGQVGGGNTVSHSALFTRAYNLIYNEWFRDQNLQNSVVVDVDDGLMIAPTMFCGGVVSGTITLRRVCRGRKKGRRLLCRWARRRLYTVMARRLGLTMVPLLAVLVLAPVVLCSVSLVTTTWLMVRRTAPLG